MRVSLSYLFSFRTHDRASLQFAPRDLRLSTFDKKNPRHSIEQQGNSLNLTDPFDSPISRFIDWSEHRERCVICTILGEL